MKMIHMLETTLMTEHSDNHNSMVISNEQKKAVCYALQRENFDTLLPTVLKLGLLEPENTN